MMKELSKYNTHTCIYVNVLDSDIVVSEMKIQLCYYIHFQTNTQRKGMNPLFLPSMG